MRRHWKFADSTTKSLLYTKGDMTTLATMTDAWAQERYFPKIKDHEGGRNKNRPRYENPLVKTWDTER